MSIESASLTLEFTTLDMMRGANPMSQDHTWTKGQRIAYKDTVVVYNANAVSSVQLTRTNLEGFTRTLGYGGECGILAAGFRAGDETVKVYPLDLPKTLNKRVPYFDTKHGVHEVNPEHVVHAAFHLRDPKGRVVSTHKNIPTGPVFVSGSGQVNVANPIAWGMLLHGVGGGSSSQVVNVEQGDVFEYGGGVEFLLLWWLHDRAGRRWYVSSAL